MIHTLDWKSDAEGALLRAMFEARKRVFVDLLKWDVPVLAGTWELDQFDDTDATYLIISERDARHLASTRLLKTTREHILADLFPVLVDGQVPRGPTTYEITRFCLDRSLRASERRHVRDQLVSALAEHALANGIERYTGVAELGWFRQIENFGWRCEPLGSPQLIGGRTLTALLIEIDEDTPDLLAAAGIWSNHPGIAGSPFSPPAGEIRA